MQTGACPGGSWGWGGGSHRLLLTYRFIIQMWPIDNPPPRDWQGRFMAAAIWIELQRPVGNGDNSPLSASLSRLLCCHGNLADCLAAKTASY